MSIVRELSFRGIGATTTLLNFVWIGFFLTGFLAAVVQLLQGDLTIFSRVLTGLFDTAKTGFEI